jgi:hypothetical protein
VPYKDIEKRREAANRYSAKNREKIRQQQAERREKYRDGINEYQRGWRADNLDRARKYEARYYLKTYGLTEVQYQELLASQDGHCALCPRVNSGIKGGRLFVDHDHQTGKIRGLLCLRCNTSLGALGDSIASLERVIIYLRRNLDR